MSTWNEKIGIQTPSGGLKWPMSTDMSCSMLKPPNRPEVLHKQCHWTLSESVCGKTWLQRNEDELGHIHVRAVRFSYLHTGVVFNGMTPDTVLFSYLLYCPAISVCLSLCPSVTHFTHLPVLFLPAASEPDWASCFRAWLISGLYLTHPLIFRAPRLAGKGSFCPVTTFCHNFCSIKATESYNHWKWGANGQVKSGKH